MGTPIIVQTIQIMGDCLEIEAVSENVLVAGFHKVLGPILKL